MQPRDIYRISQKFRMAMIYQNEIRIWVRPIELMCYFSLSPPMLLWQPDEKTKNKT